MQDISTLSRDIPYTLGGNEILFRRFTLGMLAQYTKTLQMRAARNLIDAAGEGITPKERIEIMRDSTQGSQQQELFATPEGIILALYLSALPNNPDITEQAIGDAIGLEDIEPIVAFIEQNLLAAPKQQGEGEPKN